MNDDPTPARPAPAKDSGPRRPEALPPTSDRTLAKMLGLMVLLGLLLWALVGWGLWSLLLPGRG